MATEVEHEFAADAGWLDARGFDEGEELKGRDFLLPGGYGQVVAALLRDCAGAQVRLGARVAGVSYGGGGVCSVRLAEGGEALRARAVVITVPLGVLKASLPGAARPPGAAALDFEPPLPPPHAHAIHALGFGLLDKYIVEFPQGAPVPRDVDFLGFFEEGAPLDWPEALNWARATRGGKNALVFFSAGSAAARLAGAPEAEVRARLTAQLRAMLPALPEPSHFERTAWGADPFALGSYSFAAAGCAGGGEDRKALAAPVAGRLFFAGEHTSVEYPSTVQGAMLSGMRAAEEVVRALSGGS